ncbi:hypothetical protein CRYUN_Cryun04dG0083300 [Craigia yunnanensis]
MALAASSVISHNRTVNSLAFPLPRHGNIAVNHHQHHFKVNLHSFSHPQYVYQCSNSRIFIPSCLAKTAVSDVQLHNSNLTTAAADNNFSIEGSPIELPESVVPEAYREWEVKVYDWQTQCPTLAEPGEKIMVHKLWELEHCFINPRVRIIQVVRVDGTKFVLQNIRLLCEQWYGPFRNGDQLGGCAIRDSAFASTPATKASDVLGVWQGANAVAYFDGSMDKLQNFLQELKDNGALKSIRDDSNLILLPKQLRCSLKEREEGEPAVRWGGCLIRDVLLHQDAASQEVSGARETTVLGGV